MDAYARTGDGDIGLLPRLHSLHLRLQPLDPGPRSLSGDLESVVNIIERRRNAENLASIERVVVCGSSWGCLLPYSLELDKLVPHITYMEDSVSFQKT